MNPQQKIIISLIILCLSAFAIIIFIINPLFRDIKETSEKFVFQKNFQLNAEIRAEHLKDVKTVFQAEKQNLEKINFLLIDREIPLNFIEFLEKTADDCNVSVEILPGSLRESKTEPWSFINFHISLTGSFTDFSKFLEKLELSGFPAATNSKGFLMKLSNLNIKKLSKQDIAVKKFEKFSAQDVTASFSIKVYANGIKQY